MEEKTKITEKDVFAWMLEQVEKRTKDEERQKEVEVIESIFGNSEEK